MLELHHLCTYYKYAHSISMLLKLVGTFNGIKHMFENEWYIIWKKQEKDDSKSDRKEEREGGRVENIQRNMIMNNIT